MTDQPAAPGSADGALNPKKAKGRTHSQKFLVPVLVAIGLILGELISYASTSPQPGAGGNGGGPGQSMGGGFNGFPHFQNDPLIQSHVVLTTVEVVLLVSLVVIYLKVYTETRANFSLGLVIVLFALLLQALLSYPLLIGFLGPISLGPGLSSPFADVVTVCAYSVFLYLSLE